MSQINKLDPTAGGDARSFETIKTDCTDNTISQSTVELECVDIIPENASAEEIAIPTLNPQTETECLIEAINDAHDGKIVNLEIDTAETTNITAEVVHAPTEDVFVVGIDAQNSVAEIKSLIAIPVRSEEAPQLKPTYVEKVDKSKQDERDNNATCISRLETEVRKKTKERDSYRKKLEDTEMKLAALQACYDTITNQGNSEDTLQRSVEQLRGQLAQTALMYEERNRTVTNQESQINALNNQVTSLKEVVSITRDLLQIRNMEVKQLQTEVDNMEKKISEERDRHNTMISKMDAAIRLNADLKKEYETQLSLFQNLREKYDEKITLLSAKK